MNPFILSLLILMAIANFETFLGIVGGILFCYLFFDGRDENSSIKYHLTTWSWTDWRI